MENERVRMEPPGLRKVWAFWDLRFRVKRFRFGKGLGSRGLGFRVYVVVWRDLSPVKRKKE